jgi:hypothetical protein
MQRDLRWIGGLGQCEQTFLGRNIKSEDNINIARAHRISRVIRGRPVNGDLDERHDLATGLRGGPTMAQERTVSRADLQATEPNVQV